MGCCCRMIWRLEGKNQPEDGIWAPASILLVVDDIGDGTSDVHCSYALAKPLALHLLGGHSPHLHERAGKVRESMLEIAKMSSEAGTGGQF